MIDYRKRLKSARNLINFKDNELARTSKDRRRLEKQ